MKNMTMGETVIHGNFGFGCMRLPMQNEQVDYTEFSKMIDTFIAAGFNYFDTAHGYIGGLSETAIRDCLSARYPREKFLLTNKLSSNFFNSNEEIRPLFESQLKACGVEYFDYYLMHSQNRNNYEKYKKCRAYETAFELKAEGKVKHVGLSFHDTAEVLERILADYPEIEVVQLQFNYLDYEDASVQGRQTYEVARKFGKPVIVMEPVKGGQLVKLPEEAQPYFNALQGGSNASYAIRFAAGFDGVIMVLSGMGNMDMMEDNLSYMKDFKPLNREERLAVENVCKIFRKQDMIACTACRYCMERCPQLIPIPALFACLNSKKIFGDWNSEFYQQIHSNGAKSTDCIKCGGCEEICPQHLPIRDLLEQVSEAFPAKD